MPEAPIDEHGQTPIREGNVHPDVSLRRHDWVVHPEPVPEGVEVSSQLQLRSCVTPSIGAHPGRD